LSTGMQGGSNQLWLDNYDGEPRMIMDEFRSCIVFNKLLEMLDRYGCVCQAKGTSHQLQCHMFLILSPLPLEKQYPGQSRSSADGEADLFAQLERRITYNIHLDGKAGVGQSLQTVCKLQRMFDDMGIADTMRDIMPTSGSARLTSFAQVASALPLLPEQDVLMNPEEAEDIISSSGSEFDFDCDEEIDLLNSLEETDDGNKGTSEYPFYPVVATPPRSALAASHARRSLAADSAQRALADDNDDLPLRKYRRVD